MKNYLKVLFCLIALGLSTTLFAQEENNNEVSERQTLNPKNTCEKPAE